VQLFIVGDFFRRRRRPRRANDEMPAAPLLQVLLFWVLFGTAVLFGALATTSALAESIVAAALSAFAAAASLAGSVILWHRLNR
jgi:hypothetical protein